MKPTTTIDEARQVIKEYTGPPDNFALPISDQLQDSWGVNMAIIMDALLDKGWEPNGFEQREGFRIYRYKVMS